MPKAPLYPLTIASDLHSTSHRCRAAPRIYFMSACIFARVTYRESNPPPAASLANSTRRRITVALCPPRPPNYELNPSHLVRSRQIACVSNSLRTRQKRVHSTYR